jgi:hypothetical protein
MPWWETALILVGIPVGVLLLYHLGAILLLHITQTLRRCPECNARGLRFEGGVMSTRPPGGEFDIYHCSSCESWFERTQPFQNKTMTKLEGGDLERAKENAGTWRMTMGKGKRTEASQH